MNRVELKEWAKEFVKGKRWDVLLPIIIMFLFSGFTVTFNVGDSENINYKLLSIMSVVSFAISIVVFIIQIGFTDYMVRFIKKKEYKLEILFSKFSDYARLIGVYLLQVIFIFLWTLLFIIPGIIKGIAYSLVPYLLADDKYKKLSATEILKKSEELMNGHKWDFVVLGLSFIGWHILAIFTLFILEIWILPYQQVAITKFLRDIVDADK